MAVPVLSIREEDDRKVAARLLAAGRPAAFYIGLFIIVKQLRPPWRETDSEMFWRVKQGRPSWSKLPVLALPRHSVRLVDRRRLHPSVRSLARRERWEALWREVGAPLHIIAPIRRPARFVHPAVVTSSAESASLAADRRVGADTAAFFWFHDGAWRDLAEQVARRSPPRSLLAGTSFNQHGVQPPYTSPELAATLDGAQHVEVDAVVTDPLLEEAGVFSSHTMVRLPLVGEERDLVITREGPVGAEWLVEALGLPVRRLDSTSAASRRPGLAAAEAEARARTLRPVQ